MKKYICIDIGGTAMKHGVWDENLKEIARAELPTEGQTKGGPGIVKKVRAIVAYWRKKYPVEGVAISTAGIVDPVAGSIIYASDLIPGYTGTQLKKMVEEEMNLPCTVENDVNCAGLAESLRGAGVWASSCLCLTVGTGIGGCLVVDGQVYRGISGSACEVGYMTIGGKTLQELGATSVMVKKVAQGRGITAGELNGKVIFKEAIAGIEDCVNAIDEMVDVLAQGIANMVYVANPQVVILGGGIMAQRAYLEPRLNAALDKYLIPIVRQHTRLDFAKNGNDAGMMGALIHFMKIQDEK